MNALGSQLQTGLQVLAMPLNLVALLVGTLAGALLGAMFRCIGVSGAAALVLLMPMAMALDPTTGLVLLGACLTAALVVTAHHEPEATMTPGHHAIPLTAVLAGLVVMLASASAAALLQATTPADTIALLICGAAAAIVLAAATHPAGWPAAIGLTVAGIALQLSALKPLNTEEQSPLPLLFGLLVIGPAVMALALPQRIVRWTTSLGGIELAATVLPAFLMGVPATRGVSVFALDLGENGLRLGPRLMTQRPKLVLGFVVALVVAGLIGVVGRLITARIARPARWPQIKPLDATRAAGGMALVLAIGALYAAVSKSDGAMASLLPVVLAASAAGAFAAWFGLELAPLVTGLVIGQLMSAPLTTMRAKTDGGALAALISGSTPLLVLATLAIVGALTWPLLQRRASS